MALETFTAYLANDKTHVVVRDTDPDLNVNFTAVLDGDFMSKSKTELLQLGLAWFTGKYVQEYANQKTVEAVVEVKDKIAQIDDAIDRSNKQYDRVEELLKVTTATVNELIMSLMSEEEEADTDEPETEVN